MGRGYELIVTTDGVYVIAHRLHENGAIYPHTQLH